MSNIRKDDIPTTPEQMQEWQRLYGSVTDDASPIGGVDDRFETSSSSCSKSEDAQSDEELKQKVIEQLKTIYDPELPVDIYNLGLIYNIECWRDKNTKLGACKVTMTLTSATCSMSEMIVDLVRSIPSRTDDLECLDVELVFDPPWNQEKMSDEAKLAMGML